MVVASLYEAVASRLDAVAAHLWLEDPPTATLRLVGSCGRRAPAPSPVATDDPVLGTAVVSARATFRAIARIHEHGREATLWRFAVPVGVGNARGVVAVDVAAGPEPPDSSVLIHVTASLRGALAAALALHVAHAETDTARVLLDAARELSSRLRSEDVVRVALERAMEVSDAATGSVMIPDENGLLRIVASRGLPSEVVSSTVVRSGEGIAGWVHASGTAMLVEDLPGRPSAPRHGVRSAVCAPMCDGPDRLGVINVGSRVFPARFTDEHVRALETIGSQAGVALHNARALERSRELYLSSLQALAVALETKDPCSIGGSGRVADLAAMLGTCLDLGEEELASLQVAALLHDIGMGMAAGGLGTSSRPLSTVDHGLLRAHPEVAADVLRQVPTLEAVVPIVYHHHERYDGHGYNAGLAGDAIPLGSRILAVADAFVAMTGERPYRAAMTSREAMDELSANSGSQFDPLVVEAFSRLLKKNPDLALADR